MKQLTIELPDELALILESVAVAQKITVQQVALGCLGSFMDPASSPQALLRTVRDLPHASSSAVDELDASIAASQLPVQCQGAFDERSSG